MSKKVGRKLAGPLVFLKVLGQRPVLFSIVMNLNNGTECTFSRFVNDIRLWRNSQYIPIHWGLKWEGWADRNPIKFLKKQ